MNIAIIPARGGSKRIPRKNIKEFSGKPMISWSIEAAKKSKLFDHIIVSTDDDEVAEIATTWGAEVPFIRPKELSDDYVGTTPVITHAVNSAIEKGWDLSAVCCIYATAPLIQSSDIKIGLELLESGDFDYAIAATNFNSPIFRGFRECSKGGVEMVFPEHYMTRSQDLEVVFHDAGQFYWGRPDAWLHEKKGLGKKTALVKIPSWRVQDIDNEDDWKRAETIASLISNKQDD